jgi:hypothetical protein
MHSCEDGYTSLYGNIPTFNLIHRSENPSPLTRQMTQGEITAIESCVVRNSKILTAITVNQFYIRTVVPPGLDPDARRKLGCVITCDDEQQSPLILSMIIKRHNEVFRINESSDGMKNEEFSSLNLAIIH